MAKVRERSSNSSKGGPDLQLNQLFWKKIGRGADTSFELVTYCITTIGTSRPAALARVRDKGGNTFVLTRDCLRLQPRERPPWLQARARH